MDASHEDIEKVEPNVETEERAKMFTLGIYCHFSAVEITQAAREFFIEGHELLHFIGAFYVLAKKLDTTLDDLCIMGGAMIGDGSAIPRDSMMVYADATKPYKAISYDLMHARIIDLFLNYLSELFALIYIARPEMLKSSAEMKVDEILEHSSMDELIESIAEKKVNDLAYLGFEKLNKTIESQMGESLVPDPDDYRKMILAIEFRNLFVHNRGIANKTYLNGVNDKSIVLGQKITSRKTDWLDTIAKIVLDIDSRFATKFGIQRTISYSQHLCRTFGEIQEPISEASTF